MKTITLQSISKSFEDDLIINNLSYQFNLNHRFVIKGNNGSGKSTLLKIISGMLPIDSGNIKYIVDNVEISDKIVNYHIAYCSPYMQLPIDFSVEYFFIWSDRVRKLQLTPQEIVKRFDLEKIKHTELKKLSSGTYQKIKLIYAFMSDSYFLLLDEPCVNLDVHAVKLYENLLADFSHNRIIILASNDEREFNFKHETLNLNQV